MSALPPKADMCSATQDVRYVPKADIHTPRVWTSRLGHSQRAVGPVASVELKTKCLTVPRTGRKSGPPNQHSLTDLAFFGDTGLCRILRSFVTAAPLDDASTSTVIFCVFFFSLFAMASLQLSCGKFICRQITPAIIPELL